MRTAFVGLYVLAGMLLAGVSFAAAQTESAAPPAIVAFTSDLESIPFDAAEAGSNTAELSWQSVNLMDEHHLALEAIQLGDWDSLLEDDEQLPPSGTRPITVQHPLNFGAPTYRLSIVNNDGDMLDQRIIIIPYTDPCAVESGPDATPEPGCSVSPVIELFETEAQEVEAGSLAQGTARIAVSWQVNDRLPTSNLVFEQILADGSSVSVEQPRANLWVSSEGRGMIAPVAPRDGNTLRIQLRIVDLVSGETYDAQEVTIPIIGTIASAPTAIPTRAAQPAPTTPQIVSFTATPNPADPSGSVLLRWEVRGAASVELSWLDADLENMVRRSLEPVGELTVPFSQVRITGTDATFHLIALDANGEPLHQPDELVVGQSIVVTVTTEVTINSFTANPQQVERAGTVTLSWDASNTETVSIWRLSPEGTYIPMDEGENLDPGGSIVVTVPEHYTTAITYLIGATDSYGVTINEQLTVGITCPYDNFFSDTCPLTQERIEAAYQPFQGGFMLWRGDTREIYALFNDRSYTRTSDTWTPGEVIEIDESPPAGLIQPQRGFGKVWVNQPEIRERLGWATGDETGYTTTLETINRSWGRYPTTSTLLRLPDGRIVEIHGALSTWEYKP